MNKINYLKKEISYVKDASKRKDLRILIGLLPDYFFEIPASSSGKYHPAFALMQAFPLFPQKLLHHYKSYSIANR